MIKLCLVALLSSGNSSELIKNLKVVGPRRGDPKYVYEPVTMYSVKLPEVKKGDVVTLVSSYGEMTNDNGWNAMLGNCVRVCSGTSYDSCFKEVTECKTTNITPGQHHWTFVEPSVKFFAEEDLSGKFINQIVYSASSQATGSQTLTVEEDYGGLQVMVERQCEGKR